MLIETISSPWVKALAQNKREGMLDPVQLWATPPDAANPLMQSGYNARGVWDLGQGGEVTVQRVKVMPYCEGQPGSVFWMRVYGWSAVGRVENDPLKACWVPDLLGEFLCVAGNIPGPRTTDSMAPTSSAVQPTENVCDAITMTAGVLGLNGFICSAFPGSGIPAYAALEIYGARKVSFDFACDFNLYPDLSGIGMNCLWARL